MAVFDGGERVVASGQTGHGVVTIAVGVGAAIAGPALAVVHPRALERNAVQCDAPAGAKGRGVAHGNESHARVHAALHVTHGAAHDIIAGGAPGLGGDWRIRAEGEIAEVPGVRERVVIRIAGDGGEVHGDAGGEVGAVEDELIRRGTVGREISEIHHHIDPVLRQRSVAARDGREVDARGHVGIGAADDDGAVVLAAVARGRAGRGVEQRGAAAAVGHAVVPSIPVKHDAVEEPGVGVLAPELRPVIAVVILANLQGVILSRRERRHVEGEHPVGATRAHGLHVEILHPVEGVFERGIELALAAARTHHVVGIAVFDVAAVADDAVAEAGPEVRVPHAVVVAEFMDHHAGAVAQHPAALAAHVGLAAVAVAGATAGAGETHDVEIVVVRVVTVEARDFPRVAQDEAVAILAIPGLGLG